MDIRARSEGSSRLLLTAAWLAQGSARLPPHTPRRAAKELAEVGTGKALGGALLLTFLLRTQCGAGYETGFPEDSDIKPQRIVIPLWGFIMVHVSLRNPHYR